MTADGVTPLHNERLHRLGKVAAWLIGIAVVVAILQLLGFDVTGWFRQLWDQIKGVPPKYLIAAVASSRPGRRC